MIEISISKLKSIKVASALIMYLNSIKNSGKMIVSDLMAEEAGRFLI